MKRRVFFGMSLTLIACLLSSLITIRGNSGINPRATLAVTQLKSDTGTKLAQRIKQLKESNKNVRAALAAFEKNRVEV